MLPIMIQKREDRVWFGLAAKPEEKELIEKAAKKLKQSRNKFILSVSLQKAKEVTTNE